MSLGRISPRESQLPQIEQLPDGRRTYTRYHEVAAANQITDDLLAQLALGALDPNPLFTSATYGPYLRQRTVEPAGPEGRTYHVLRFEELKATGETSVGNADTIKTEDGRTATTQTYLQLAADTYAPQTVGSSYASGYLLREEKQDPGNVRTIKRTWVTSGILSTDEQTRNQGKLSLKTIVSAVTVPTAPSGYTLIGQPVQNPSGLPVYTYTYAKGSGLVATEERKALDGAITYVTKRAYGTAVPATGEYATSTEDDDGYTVYVSRGIVINTADLPDEITTRNQGELVITRKRRIGSAPSGTGSVILDTADPQEGYTLYTRAYAVGSGLVATEERKALDGAITYVTKRAYGTAVPATGEYATSTEDDDGYTVYVSRGIVINTADLPDEITTRNQGELVITRKRRIGSAPSGTGSVILDTADPQEGYTLYTRAYAVGSGLVATEERAALDGAITYVTKRAYGTAVPATGEYATSTEDDDGYTVYVSRGIVINTADLPDEITTRNQGELVITRKRRIGSAPSGTGSVILDTADPQEGYTLYTRAYAVGSGLVMNERTTVENGLITYVTNRSYGEVSAAPGEFERTQEDDDGYTVFISRGLEINSDTYPDIYETRDLGAVVITTKRKINSDPTGDGQLILDQVEPQRGYALHTRKFVVGGGAGEVRSVSQPDGSIEQTVVTFSASAETPANPGSGYLVALVQTPQDGYFRNLATYKVLPPTVTVPRRVGWSRPGTVAITSPSTDFILQAGVSNMDVLASVEISYGESPVSETIWAVSQWAGLRESYTVKDSGQIVTNNEALHGFLSGATSGSSSTEATYHGVTCSSFSFTIASSSPSALPSGDIVIDVRNEPYFKSLDGTMVYRSEVVTISV